MSTIVIDRTPDEDRDRGCLPWRLRVVKARSRAHPEDKPFFSLVTYITKSQAKEISRCDSVVWYRKNKLADDLRDIMASAAENTADRPETRRGPFVIPDADLIPVSRGLVEDLIQRVHTLERKLMENAGR